MMKAVATIQFKELGASDEGVVIIRNDEQSVAICLSVRKNGDLEVVMSKADAKAVLEALETALR